MFRYHTGGTVPHSPSAASTTLPWTPLVISASPRVSPVAASVAPAVFGGAEHCRCGCGQFFFVHSVHLVADVDCTRSIELDLVARRRKWDHLQPIVCQIFVNRCRRHLLTKVISVVSKRRKSLVQPITHHHHHHHQAPITV